MIMKTMAFIHVYMYVYIYTHTDVYTHTITHVFGVCSFPGVVLISLYVQ